MTQLSLTSINVFSFKDLGCDELLKKCMHGETQNINESLNNLIWTKCPKQVYVGNSTSKMSVASAVIKYNDGATGLLPVLIKLGVYIVVLILQQKVKIKIFIVSNNRTILQKIVLKKDVKSSEP